MTGKDFMRSVANGRIDIVQSKRQKDLADILRLVEAHPELKERLPAKLRKQAD